MSQGLDAQGHGVIQRNPAEACIANKRPRIISINGRSSAGIVFAPGDKLDIAGCGFGLHEELRSKVELVGPAQQIPVLIDTWSDIRITGHLDAGLTGVPDLAVVKLRVWPLGPPLLSDTAHSFKAARATARVALPPTARKTFSTIYGPRNSVSLSNAPDGTATIVERNSEQNVDRMIYQGLCPAVMVQQSSMTDVFDIAGVAKSWLSEGFGVTGVDYHNLTQQHTVDDGTYQEILVGGPGSATYIPAQEKIAVTFQGHSHYVKKMVFSDEGGRSLCTSRYSLSLNVTGPRGVRPIR